MYNTNFQPRFNQTRAFTRRPNINYANQPRFQLNNFNTNQNQNLGTNWQNRNFDNRFQNSVRYGNSNQKNMEGRRVPVINPSAEIAL